MLNNSTQLSLYSTLYYKIPENHTLKLIHDALDFSFINDLLEKSYCKYYGRPAKEPELMVKLLVLKYLYDLSDQRVIEEASLNLAYMYFLDINPEDSLPHPSLLAKFRVHRLQDITLDEIIIQVVQQCVDKGIIEKEGHGITIDSTHSEANTFKCVPERVMKRLAKKIFKTIEDEGELPETIKQDIPDYKEIEDHREAKSMMKEYLETTMEEVEQNLEIENYPKTIEIIENAKAILKDPKFLESKGVRSIVDQEARVGHKSRSVHFFGYKIEFTMIAEPRIITGVHVESGAYVDGTKFEKLLELTLRSGIMVDELYGDKAYFRKLILDLLKQKGIKPYIPVSEVVYRVNEERFSYNKDSDEWFCIQGNGTVRKLHRKFKDGRQAYRYYFDRETCRNCPLRDECISGNAVAKTLEVGIHAPEFYEYSQEQKTEEFVEKYKKRASQEWKNGEMKNFHGLGRARGYGLKSMSTQAKLTALAVNLKRIAGIISSKSSLNFSILSPFSMKKEYSNQQLKKAA